MRIKLKWDAEAFDAARPEQRIVHLTASDDRVILKATIAVPQATNATEEQLLINSNDVLQEFFPRLIEQLQNQSNQRATRN
jgi:hypothetical protein